MINRLNAGWLLQAMGVLGSVADKTFACVPFSPLFNLETAAGRARWCVWAGDWREATTRQANACKAERQSQAPDRTWQRVRSALTGQVMLGGGTGVSVHGAAHGNTSGQLRFLGLLPKKAGRP